MIHFIIPCWNLISPKTPMVYLVLILMETMELKSGLSSRGKFIGLLIHESNNSNLVNLDYENIPTGYLGSQIYGHG